MTNMELAAKLIDENKLNIDEYEQLLGAYTDENICELLRKEAVRLRKCYYGNKIYVRGLIEFTNYCKNNCYYCGIRHDNSNMTRYRLSKQEILECCDEGYKLGFRTFVLQGGEDPYFTDEMMVDIIRDIKAKFPDCAITLSIGEKSYESYRIYREAGADRYLLRHETANEEHYRKLHPSHMSLTNRKRCLSQLKELGFQAGAGFMVGSPYQTMRNLAEDLVYLGKLQPQMVGIGPFIPHHDTPFKGEAAGSVDLTVFLLSVIRIIKPDVLLPATTALGTLAEDGRERGICAGANVIMPNLSPVSKRRFYELYDNKLYTGNESAEYVENLKKSMLKIGYEIVTDRGDIAR